MLKSLLAAFALPELRQRIQFVFMMFAVFIVGLHIPVPGINREAMERLVANDAGLLVLFDTFSGGAFRKFTIFAMGITPYINASIIMQLLTVAIPRLEQLAQEGEEGRKKIAQYSRYLTVILAFVQAIGITYGLAQGALKNQSILGYIIVALTLTAGTAFLMWLGEQITENGIGNGISLIIFTSIISRLPIAVVSLWQLAFVTKTMSPWSLPVIVIFAVLMIAGVIFV